MSVSRHGLHACACPKYPETDLPYNELYTFMLSLLPEQLSALVTNGQLDQLLGSGGTFKFCGNDVTISSLRFRPLPPYAAAETAYSHMIKVASLLGQLLAQLDQGEYDAFIAANKGRMQDIPSLKKAVSQKPGQRLAVVHLAIYLYQCANCSSQAEVAQGTVSILKASQQNRLYQAFESRILQDKRRQTTAALFHVRAQTQENADVIAKLEKRLSAQSGSKKNKKTRNRTSLH